MSAEVTAALAEPEVAALLDRVRAAYADPDAEICYVQNDRELRGLAKLWNGLGPYSHRRFAVLVRVAPDGDDEAYLGRTAREALEDALNSSPEGAE